MSTQDYLKLTAYFAERERTGGRLLAEALLDLYGSRQVATSVMLRGIASFGPRNVVRTDESLSLSEDLPVVITAVDTSARIGALTDDVVAMISRGLVTLERARLVRDAILADGTVELAGPGDAVTLTVYLRRTDRVPGKAAHVAVCDVVHRNGFAGAITLLGVDGTTDGRRRRARFFGRNTDVPMKVIATGTKAQAAQAITELNALLNSPMMTVERAQICKRDGVLIARPHPHPADDPDGRPLWQKLTVHTSEATRHDGVPIHRALVRRLRESGTASGATAVRGIWGFHGDHKPHGDKLIQFGRQVPVTTIIIDTPEEVARSFDIVDELTGRHGLVTSELVPAMLAIDRGERRGGTDPLARHDY